MTELAWMKTYIGDEIALTIDLTAEEFGAYERLRRHYWQHGGLPDDDRRLMRITGVEPERWEDVRSAICGLFEEGWRLPRLDEERAAAGEQRAKAVERSQKAHAARYGGRARTPASASSTATSSPSSTALSIASSSATSMPVAVLEACPPAPAPEEVRYEERLALTQAHARDKPVDPDLIPKPENETKGRAWLLRQGLGDRHVEQFLPSLMRGRLYQSQVDQVLSR